MQQMIDTIAFGKQSVSEIVRNDYRTADIFKKYGINYCCGGTIPLEEACAAKNIDIDQLHTELAHATQNIIVPNTLHFNEWKPDFLVDYIRHVQHAYFHEYLPTLEHSVIGFANSHLKQYPFLTEVIAVVQQVAAKISMQKQQEEHSLFPYIKQLESAHRNNASYGSLLVRTMKRPFQHVESEYEDLGRLLIKLRSLTDNYQYKPNACTNQRVVWNKLKELDNNLVQYIHLKKNILLPKAISMENELLSIN